jgi:mannose-6-phosphate isomerase-like protein (cupin superfamily)
MKKLFSIEDRVYKIENGVEVPDKTMVFPIIDPEQQRQSGLEIFEPMSLAMGELEKGEVSSIHVHPIIAHVTWVLSGKLQVKMKDHEHQEAYTLDVDTNQAVLTKPGTFFQLINRGSDTCKILYQCAPAFVFDMDENGTVFYNDAIVLENYTWEKLQQLNWDIPELKEDIESIKKRRLETIEKMQQKK